ncbi:MAG: TetR/AcrR family transcriptional regulator [Longimicrobiales bacterium]
MPTPDEQHQTVKPPQQARSRRTELAIANALSALLREKPFADISVAEIASGANVSVGGFYARFASKDALLALVELGILESFNEAAASALDPARFRDLGIEAITLAYAQLLVTHLRAHRIEIVQILKYTRPRSDTEERLRQFNMGVHDRMRALLLERREQIRATMSCAPSIWGCSLPVLRAARPCSPGTCRSIPSR